MFAEMEYSSKSVIDENSWVSFVGGRVCRKARADEMIHHGHRQQLEKSIWTHV
jgi:hypothetical protein